MASTRDPGKTFFGVQALRAVAALLVVVHHALSAYRDRMDPRPHPVLLWDNGMCGVDIFFVISGFVMAISAPGLAGLANPGWVFFRRRLIRIVPLYWIFTTLRFLKLKFGFHMPDQTLGSAWHVIASYLFIPSLDPGNSPIPLLGVGWTLNFEMMFYVLFTVALVWGVAPLKFLLPTLGVIAVVGWFDHPGWPLFPALASPLVLEFLFGIVLAHFTLQNRLPGRLVSLLLVVGGFAVILTISFPFYTARAFYWGVPAAAIVTGMVGLETRIGRRIPKLLLEAGNASYSTYLVHGFVLPVLWVVLVRGHQTGTTALAELIALSLVLCLVAGEIVHRWIELPLLHLMRGKRVPGVSVLPT